MRESRMDQNQMPLCDILAQYEKEQRIRLSMPGHKGGFAKDHPLVASWGAAVFQWDVTELAMTDQLYHAQGCLKDAQVCVAELLGCKKAFFLVNGASAGLMAGIFSAVKSGERVLVPRNAHGCIWRGIALAGGEAVVLPVAVEETLQIPLGIDIEQLEETIVTYDIKAMIAIYPTYHGLMIDIAGVIDVCHKHGVKLIVDMAHGGHLPFLGKNFADPVALGADIVVQGWHKTMGSLTQTGIACVQNESLPFGESLLYFQSTSPSYLLMASLDSARWLWAKEGERLGAALCDWGKEFAAAIDGLSGWQVTKEEDFPAPVVAKDPTRVLIANQFGLSGFTVAERLSQLGLDVEMAEWNMVTVILALGDLRQKERILSSVIAALKQISLEKEKQTTAVFSIEKTEKTEKIREKNTWQQRVEVLPALPRGLKRKKVSLDEAAGSKAAEMLSLYPPGVPLLFPGQEILSQHIDVVKEMLAMGGVVQGCEQGCLWVFLEEENM